MSLNKKSLVYLIVLLLSFAIIYVLSTMFFGKDQKTTEDQLSLEQQDLSNETAPSENEGQDINALNNVTATGIDAIATKGRVHALAVPDIYGERGIGNPSAPIKVQEFFSLTCNHCAEFHKTQFAQIKTDYIDTGKVYFIRQEFPLNGPALYGSMTARCLPEDKYEGFVDMLFRQQDAWAFSGDFKTALLQNAKLAGMSDEEFETCFNNKELQQSIATVIKEASDVWKINSTPSFVINDGEYVIYGGKSYEDFATVFKHILSEDTAPSSSVSSENIDDAASSIPETDTGSEESKIPPKADISSTSELPSAMPEASDPSQVTVPVTEMKSTIEGTKEQVVDTLDNAIPEEEKPLE